MPTNSMSYCVYTYIFVVGRATAFVRSLRVVTTIHLRAMCSYLTCSFRLDTDEFRKLRSKDIPLLLLVSK